MIMMAMMLKFNNLVDGALGLGKPISASTESLNAEAVLKRSSDYEDEINPLLRSSSNMVNSRESGTQANLSSGAKNTPTSARQRQPSHSLSHDVLDKDRSSKPLRLKTADGSSQKNGTGVMGSNAPNFASLLSAHSKDIPAKGSHSNIKARGESVPRVEPASRPNIKSREGSGRDVSPVENLGSKSVINGKNNLSSSLHNDDDEPVTRSRGDVSRKMSVSRSQGMCDTVCHMKDLTLMSSFTALRAGAPTASKTPEEYKAKLKRQMEECFASIFKYHEEYMRCKMY